MAETLQVEYRGTGARASGTEALQCEVLSEPATFEQLRADWDALLEDSAQHRYFLRCEWNQLWWTLYGPPGSQLHIITCRDPRDRALVGLAPLYRRRLAVFGVPWVSELLFLGTGIHLKSSEHLDIIARAAREDEVADSMAAFLQRRSDWDRLWFWKVPEDSIMMASLDRALGGGLATKVCDRAPYVDTLADWEAFKATLGRNMRNKVEYYPRRLQKRHACEFRRVETIEALDAALDALVKLHQARWQSRGEPGAFRDPAFEALLRQAAQRGFAAGRVRLWTLGIDGSIGAALLGFLDNGVLHYLQQGYSPDYPKENLGVTMLALVIRDCIDDPGVRAFDFTGGGARYKEEWTPLARTNTVREFNRPHLRSLIFRAAAWGRSEGLTLLRKVTPTSIRAARRDWLRRRRLRV